MNSMSKVIELPNFDHNECFGCGEANNNGLKMKFFAEDDKVFSKITIPSHLMGWNGIAHGGIVSTLLDEIMGWSAIFFTHKLILTKNMTVTYHKPVMVNDPLRVEGHLHEKTSDREAVMKGALYNGKGELCTTSVGHFALLEPEFVKKMNIMADTDVDQFIEIINSSIALQAKK